MTWTIARREPLGLKTPASGSGGLESVGQTKSIESEARNDAKMPALVGLSERRTVEIPELVKVYTNIRTVESL